MKKSKFLAMASALALTAALMNPLNTLAANPGMGEITVGGTGAVNMTPDVAYVSLGVNAQDASPKKAQEKNNEAVEKVIAALKAMGIAEKDIRTTNFYMYPNYGNSGKGMELITGYTVNNTVTATVRDIKIVGEVLSEAADAGANVSNGVQFGLLDSSAAYNEALTLAMENASDKAQTIAKTMGKIIGSPSSVTESGGSYTPVYNSMQRAAMDTVGGAGGAVPLQAGELTVTANVQMVFEYTR